MNIAKIAADFKVRVTFSPADMSKPAAIREMIEKTLQTSGRLDIPGQQCGNPARRPVAGFPPGKVGCNPRYRFFIPLGWRFLRCSRTSGAASSISRRRSARQFHAWRRHGQARAHNIPREKVIRDVLLAQQPNKRFASVEELGALSVFLASDAAGSITGIALPVDGGWTAH